MDKDASPRSEGPGRAPGRADRGRELLEGLRRESALRPESYRYYARRVASVVYRVLGNDRELHDLVQETFLRALTSLGTFRGGPESIDAWLTRIAVYTAHAQIRRYRGQRKRYLAIEDWDDELELSSVVSAPTDVDALRRAFRALALLPDEQGGPLSLHLLEEMTMSEIAATCGFSESTAKRRIRRGKQRFDALCLHDPALRGWVSGAEP